MKNILVVGGSYFAGRVCVEELHQQPGLAIHVFNRGNRPLNIAGVTELRGDRDRAEDIRAAIPALAWDAVIDFCAYAPAQVDTLLANLSGSVRQYLFISTTSVLQAGGTKPLTEDDATLDGPQLELGHHGHYAHDKLLAEAAVRERCTRSGIAFTILRPAIIYGYYNYAPRETYFFDLLRKRSTVVLPCEDFARFSFIWVVDMARLIGHCLGDARTYDRTFNLASDEAVSYDFIIDVLEEITGKPIPVARLPAREIDRQGIPLPFPLTEHLLYSGEMIRRLFEFPYTPFKKGMREALKYYLLVQRTTAA